MITKKRKLEALNQVQTDFKALPLTAQAGAAESFITRLETTIAHGIDIGDEDTINMLRKSVEYFSPAGNGTGPSFGKVHTSN